MLLPLVVLPITLRSSAHGRPFAGPGSPRHPRVERGRAVPRRVVDQPAGPALVFRDRPSPCLGSVLPLRGSNAGSVIGLLAYPLVVEPNLPIAAQGVLWSIGYVVFVVACVACAVVLRGEDEGPARRRRRTRGHDRAISIGRRRLRWVVLAFIPSSLLLGVTTRPDRHRRSPLWAIPLSLYLLTFVIAFSPRQPVGPGTLAWILPFLVVTDRP